MCRLSRRPAFTVRNAAVANVRDDGRTRRARRHPALSERHRPRGTGYPGALRRLGPLERHLRLRLRLERRVRLREPDASDAPEHPRRSLLHPDAGTYRPLRARHGAEPQPTPPDDSPRGAGYSRVRSVHRSAIRRFQRIRIHFRRRRRVSLRIAGHPAQRPLRPPPAARSSSDAVSSGNGRRW